MDLWDVTSNFLVSNVTSKNFRLNDVLTLSNHLKIQLKPPRNANSGQLTFLVRDLLDVAKAQFPVLDFVYRVSQVKPFEVVGVQLKDRLMSESIMCMNGTLRTVYDQQKEITRIKQLMETSNRSRSSLEDSMKDLSAIDYVSNPSPSRPLEHPSRPGSRTNGSDKPTMRRSSSYIRQASGGAEIPEDDLDTKTMVRQMNVQLMDQKKAVAKMSKLCLGALTSIDQLESKVGQQGIDPQVSINQPMERIKKLSEDTVKLNNFVRELDVQVQEVEKKIETEVQNMVSPLNHLARLEQDVGETRMNVRDEMRILREDMKIFVAKSSDQAQSVTHQVAQLEKSMGENSKHSRELQSYLEKLRHELSDLGKDLSKCEDDVSQNEKTFEKVLRTQIEQEVKAIKELQSQSFKNQNLKVTNDFVTFKEKVERQMHTLHQEHAAKISQLEFIIDDLQGKSKSMLDPSSVKELTQQIASVQRDLTMEVGSLKKGVQSNQDETEKIANEVKKKLDMSQGNHLIEHLQAETQSQCNTLKQQQVKLEKEMRVLESQWSSSLETQTEEQITNTKAQIERLRKDLEVKVEKEAKAVEKSLGMRFSNDLKSVESKIASRLDQVNMELNKQQIHSRGENEKTVVDLRSKLESSASAKDLESVKIFVSTELKKVDEKCLSTNKTTESHVQSLEKKVESQCKQLNADLSQLEKKASKQHSDLETQFQIALKEADTSNNVKIKTNKDAIDKAQKSFEATLESHRNELKQSSQDMVETATNSLSTKFDENVDRKLKMTEKSLGNLEGQLESRLKEITNDTNKKSLETVTKMDSRFTTFDKSLGNLENKLESRFKEVANDANKKSLDADRKMDSKLTSLEKSLGTDLEGKLNSRFKNADDLSKMSVDADKKVDSKFITLEKSLEANLESQMRKLKQDTSASFITKSAHLKALDEIKKHSTNVEPISLTIKDVKGMIKEAHQSEVKPQIDDMNKKYETLKAETVKDLKSSLANVDRKLSAEVQMAKKELTSHIDNSVKELKKSDFDALKNEVKAFGQQWSLVKAIETDLTKLQQKVKTDEITREQLTKEIIKAEQDILAKEIEQVQKKLEVIDILNDDVLRIDQFIERDGIRIDDLVTDVTEILKTMKEDELDRKFQIESLQKEIKESGEANCQVEKLQASQAKLEEQLNNVDSHLEFVHQELAKSIHIIDKHSLEIDDVAIKCKDGKNAQNDILDLQDNLKTVQLHIAGFKDNVSKLGSISDDVQDLKVKLKATVGTNDSQEVTSSLRKKSITPPSPRPRDKSPGGGGGVLKNEIDELKVIVAEGQTSHKRLKKLFETFRKAMDSDLTGIYGKIEQSVELLTDKLTHLESDHQDNASNHEHLKRNLRNMITDELEKCKQVREMEHKVAKIKELLVRHDKTFAEILESLSLNQMSINDLRGYLLRDK